MLGKFEQDICFQVFALKDQLLPLQQARLDLV
jgi:hypothetical protein